MPSFKKYFLYALFLVCASAWGDVCSGTAKGTANCSIAVNGQMRFYTLHVPVSFKPGQKLVIAFHPATRPSANGMFNGWAQYPGQTFLGTSDVGKYSDAEGFVAAFPSAVINVGGTYNWNYWQDGGTAEFPSPVPDDVAFTFALIEKLIAQFPVNPKAVHIEGFSGGAMFTYWFAQQRPALIASFAIMEGQMIQPLQANSGNVAGIIFAGTKDTVMGYCAGVHTGSTVAQIFQYWAGVDGGLCAGTLTGAPSAFANGIQFYEVTNGGHSRYSNDLSSPSATLPYAPALNGQSGSYETKIINAFQNAHPQP